MDTRLTILIISCDKYKDIVQQYLYYLNLNWDDCNFPIAVAMEEDSVESKEINLIKCGKGVSWTQEALTSINKIESEYVLLTVDDLFISKKVNNSSIIEALNFMIDNNLSYYRIPKYKHKFSKDSLYPGNNNVIRIRKDEVYSVSIGSAIWKKDELRKILGDGSMTAWELEESFSKLALDSKPEYFENYVSDIRPLLQCAHMVTAGKWIPSGVKEMREQGYIIDTSSRGLLSTSEVIKIKLYSKATKIIPKKLRRPIKMLFSKFGFKFATKY